MVSQKASKTLRLALSSLLGVGIAASSVVVASPATAKATVWESDANGNVCESDVAVIGVRGSGQDEGNVYKKQYNLLGWNVPEWTGIEDGVESYKLFEGTPAQSKGDASDHITGFSNEVATAAFELRKKFPDSLKFGWVPIEYDAVHVRNAVRNKAEYTKSFQGGAELIQDAVINIVDNCVTTEIAIIGFSQGSQATHEALSRLSSKYRARISSVTLIADPARGSNDKVAMHMNEETNNITDSAGFAGAGIFHKDSWLRRGLERTDGIAAPRYGEVPEPSPLPEDMKGRILNVCVESDLVCNARPSSLMVDLAIGSHGEIYQSTDHEGLYERPASWAHGLISKSLLSDRVVRSGSGGSINPYKHFSKTVLCPDVNFIFAGGQYDDPVGGQSGEGAGIQLAADIPAEMLDGIVKATPGKTIGIKGARYDADGTYGLDENGGDEAYRSNTQSGIDATKKAVKESIEECKDTRIILFGNEQGAQVMHEVAASGLDKDQLSKIDAVILMGDPMRSGEDSAVKEFAGVNGETMGDDASALHETGGRLKGYAQSKGVLNFPSELSGKVMSICASADGLCNPDPKEKDEGGYMGAYNMFGTFWEEPAKWASDLIKK